jgi:hypothetical protein
MDESVVDEIHELRDRTGRDFINAKQKDFRLDAMRLGARYDAFTEVLRIIERVPDIRHNDGTLCQGLDH